MEKSKQEQENNKSQAASSTSSASTTDTGATTAASNSNFDTTLSSSVVEAESAATGATAKSSSASSQSGSGATKEEEEDANGKEGESGGSGGDTPCECVQCEVCMAENWWRMAAYHNTLVEQQRQAGVGDSSSADFDAATGLDLIGSAATLMLSQQQAAASINGGGMGGSSAGAAGAAPPDDMLRADFSMPKLKEFFESQKGTGIPNFPEDFDEFWLLVVKARLFNIFKYRGPEAYNRIVLKIRNIARQFREQVEERERQEAAAAAMTAIIKGTYKEEEGENGGTGTEKNTNRAEPVTPPKPVKKATAKKAGGKKSAN